MTVNEVVTIGVYGLGNILLEDDGLGPCVIGELNGRFTFPPHVEVDDLGTPGLDLVPYLSRRDAVIMVDATSGSEPPGTLRVFRREDIIRHPPPARMSPHDPGLKESLQLVELEQGRALDICLVGVVVERTDHGTGLSEAVKDAVPAAVEAVLTELHRLGVRPAPKADAVSVEPWWT